MASAELIAKVNGLESPLDEFVSGYLQALGFTGRGEREGVDHSQDWTDEQAFEGSGDFDQNWNVWEEIQDHISDDELTEILDDCSAFLETAKPFIESDADNEANWSQAGTDFCFTRNREGAGFWDGDWSNGDELTKQSKPFGTHCLVVVRNEEDEIVSVYCHG